MPLQLSGSGTTTQDFLLPGPQPLPNGTTITNRFVNGNGTPIVYWHDDLTLTTTGCAGGAASYALTLAGQTSPVRSGPMAEGPAGTYTAIIPALYPNHGNAHVDITIVCAGTATTFGFDIYINPSGTVRTTGGAPIAGATVTLYRSDSSAGPFVQVPNGSAIMSPVNRNDPDTTDANGHFGWDVIAGFYTVRAEKTGCVSPTIATQTYVESAVLTVPPAVSDLDLRLSCADAVPPVTVATATPAANANGWNNTDVTVNLVATDNAGGSGVHDITFALSGAQTLAATTVAGASGSITVNTEGITTITFHTTDNAGNRETAQTLVIKLDKTAPTVTTTRTPAANADGWNNVPVAVHFAAHDAGSGFTGGADATSDQTLSAEGAAQSVTQTFTDLAGNAGTATVSGINIDLHAPVTTATPDRAPNASGWYKAAVSVTLAATGNLSGVRSTAYALDGGAWTAYTAAVAITTEGIHSLQYRSTDKADNLEGTSTLVLKIDLTAPEAYLRFDPGTKDVAVFGTDALSGTSALPVASTSATTARVGHESSEEGNAELRTYTVTDNAGNTLTLVVRVKRDGHELRSSLVTTAYNGAAATTAAPNEEGFEWSTARDGSIKELEQDLQVGREPASTEVEAKYRADRDVTTIKTERPETAVTKTGLVLLRLATDHGNLAIEY